MAKRLFTILCSKILTHLWVSGLQRVKVYKSILVVHMALKGNGYKTNCRLYMKDGNTPGCLVKKIMQIRPTV